MERTISPSLERQLQDSASYLDVDDGRLCPGIRFLSSPLTDIGHYAEAAFGTISGVLLWKDAMECLTVSNHGFPTSEVYYPNTEGRLIGEIVFRKPSLDIALAKIFSPFSYTNTQYFFAETPKCRLRYSEIGKD